MFWINTRKKERFLIAPEEFASVFEGFSFVVTGAGVKQGYIKSDAGEIENTYRALFELLASGKRCVWEEDWPLLRFNTGVTAHPENCIYVKKRGGLLVPDFKEPCIELSVFCAIPFGRSPVSIGWLISQYPQYAIGLEASFPSRITRDDGSIVLFDQLTDHGTWNVIIKRIKAIAPMLRIRHEGKTFGTRIRVSRKAKESLEGFSALKESGLELL